VNTEHEWASKMAEALGNGLRYNPILTNGQTVISSVILEIKLESYRDGMTRAADMCIDCDSGVLGAREAIIKARDAITTLDVK